MVKQTTIRNSTVPYKGKNVYNGRENYVRFHPAKDNRGKVFRVGNEEISADLSHAFLYKSPRSLWFSNAIGVGGYKEKAVHVEHLLADVEASGIDNVIIELSDGVGTRFNCYENYVVEDLYELKVDGSEDRINYRVKKGLSDIEQIVIDEKAGDRIEVLPSREFHVEYFSYYPHESVGEQHYDFEVSQNKYLREIINARPIFFMPSLIPEFVLRNFIQPFYGVTDSNSLLIGNEDEPKFRNGIFREGTYGKGEFVRHKVMDAWGAIALMGMHFVETRFIFDKTGHGFDIYGLRTLKNREVFEVVNGAH